MSTIKKYRSTTEYINKRIKVNKDDPKEQKKLNLYFLEEVADLHDHVTSLYALNTAMAEAITGILLREKERLAQENKELKEVKGAKNAEDRVSGSSVPEEDNSQSC